MSEIGDPVGVALGEVVALEHPRDRDLRGQAQHVVHVERREPLGVAPDLDALGRHVEDGADLRRRSSRRTRRPAPWRAAAGSPTFPTGRRASR